MSVPSTLIAGDTWSWTESLTAYPASTWSLSWYFENSGASFSVVATPAGDDHSATVDAATTAGYQAGDYYVRGVATSGLVRQSIDEGFWVTVKPDPAAAGALDHRSHPRKVAEMIEAYLEDPTNVTAASYSLGGRSLSRWSRAELRVELDKCRQELRFEGRGVKARRYYVRTSRA
jgi:hypothetical protein